MSGNFKPVDHTADIAFEVSGETIEELFIASANAWRSSVADKVKLGIEENKNIELSCLSREQLLVDFLSELNFFLLTNKWLMNQIKQIKINNVNTDWNLSAEVSGVPVTDKVNLKQEIKAITFHQMNIIKSGNKYSTLLVFDI